MNEIKITEKLSYICASDDPLSADIGIYRDHDTAWLFDVGNGEKNVRTLTGAYNVVLSHFHQDHIGNLDKIRIRNLYVSGKTFGYVHFGTIIDSDTAIGNLRIFPLPSSHASGCLGLEIEAFYAFVGDALYSKFKNSQHLYNAQLLKAEIEVLKQLRAPYLLVSHYKGFIREREDVIAELEGLYKLREKNDPYIICP